MKRFDQKRYSVIFLLLILNIFFLDRNVSFSVPALNQIHFLKQSDGTIFAARQWGDEWSHGWETEDGYTIHYDRELKNWVFAIHGPDGSLMGSSAVVGMDSPPVDLA
jgi:hypothetical protein